MSESAERQPKQKKEPADTQAPEITNETDSLQINTYQSASATPPTEQPPPPNEPNSWQGLQSRIGNQRLQRLLTNPSIQLHRNTIRDLQSKIGNQAVQRLLKSNKLSTSTTETISRTLKPSATIQRRIPQLEDIDDEALETANQEDNEVNRRGLRVVLRRAMQDMDPTQSRNFLSNNVNGITNRDTILTGTTQQLMDLVRRIESLNMTGADDRSLILEDTTSSAVPVRRHSNFPAIRAAINTVSDLLVQIGTSATHDQHLRDVFGEHEQYGWEQAKARFPRAGRMLRRALARDHIRYDQTDSTREMGAGGSTQAGRYILVTLASVNAPDSAEAQRVYSHEAFHYAYSDIRDAGGYRRSNIVFDNESPQVKFNNADHYGEVYRRAIGGGDTFQGSTGEPLPYQDMAADQTRQAWTSAAYIFETFRDQHNRQQRGRRVRQRMVNTLLHHSILFELTYHQRHRGRNTPINEIDLALAEGVARRLQEAIGAINNPSGLPDRNFWNNWNPLLARIELGIRDVGGITDTPHHDAKMVQYLASLGNDIVDIQTRPPDLYRQGPFSSRGGVMSTGSLDDE